MADDRASDFLNRIVEAAQAFGHPWRPETGRLGRITDSEGDFSSEQVQIHAVHLTPATAATLTEWGVDRADRIEAYLFRAGDQSVALIDVGGHESALPTFPHATVSDPHLGVWHHHAALHIEGQTTPGT